MNDETKCVYCGDPSAHPGTRKCSDSTACDLRMAYQDVRTLRARVAELEAYAKLADSDAEGEERRADELEARVAELETQAAARYDCKGGPGTTAPACGGCVTCLHRVIGQAEARAEKAEAQVAARREPLPQVVPLIHPSNFSEPLREEIEREREATPRPAPPSSSIK